MGAALRLKDERTVHMCHVGKIEPGLLQHLQQIAAASHYCWKKSLKQPPRRALFAVPVPPEVFMTCVASVRNA